MPVGNPSSHSLKTRNEKPIQLTKKASEVIPPLLMWKTHFKFFLLFAFAFCPELKAKFPNLDCGPRLFDLSSAAALSRLADAETLTSEELTYVRGILDQVHPPSNSKEIKIRRTLDKLLDDPNYNDFFNDENMVKALSGYWTLNALKYLLSDDSLPAEKRANLFRHFAEEITERTKTWAERWKMEAIKNPRGDVTFLGALHCLVILNEPQGRVFKGIRPNRDQNNLPILNYDDFFAGWDPRQSINKEIFLVKKSKTDD